jgi:hypothetical protein
MSALLASRYQILEMQRNLSASPRYLFNYHLGWAGVLWIYTLYYYQVRNQWVKALLGLLFMTVIILHFSVSVESWKNDRKWYLSAATQSTLAVLQASNGYTESLGLKQCPGSQNKPECLRVVNILKESAMGPFSSKKLEKYLQACEQKVVSWKTVAGGKVRFVFSNKVDSMPVSISINDEYHPVVGSFGKFKVVDVKASENRENQRVVFSCYKNGEFVPFDEVYLSI